MRHAVPILAFTLIACGGGNQPAESAGGETNAGAASASAPSSSPETAPGEAKATTEAKGDGGATEFTTLDTHTAKETHGTKASTLKATNTEALMKLVVVDKDKGPVQGIVISMTGADGKKFYTEETDATGYAEVLVPIGQKYDIVYVSLGRKDVTATYDVENKPRQNIKLTLRYKRIGPEKSEHIVLEGINFDTNKATIRPDSFPQLDRVVEFMTKKKNVRIQISGHTDNVGKREANKSLSEKRARAVRDYIVGKGVDGSRVEAVGYGDEKPIAPNTSEEGRQRNRRIEATEL